MMKPDDIRQPGRVRTRHRHALFGAVAVGGVLAGTVLFCLSLTPSMVPRGPVLQGALGGLVFSIGYAAWFLARRLLDWLGVGAVPGGVARLGAPLVLGGCAVAVALALSASVGWQNSIRAAWGLPEADTAAPLTVMLVALAVFAVLLLAGRIFLMVVRGWSRRSARVLPPRLAGLIGILAALAIFAAVIDGLAVRSALRAIDGASRVADAFIAPDFGPPTDPAKPGSAASLVAWQDLGRWGRDFVASGPTADDIAGFWGEPAREPLRVYVGLNAAPSAAERARLAFDELLRVGGFERDVLVVAMPTGSGWLDPGGMDALDYIAKGDVATVAVQYSYLSSPVSVIVDPTHGIEEAQRLFDLVYRHWTTLPRDGRPRLYLHGLSLGAFLSQETVPLLDVLGDPFHGALWAGSPYLSDFWQRVISGRQPDTPAWRPRFGNGSLIRSMNQSGGLEAHDAPWGPIRMVLLQYGSDPIVFFDWSLAFRRPDWLSAPRAPDLSPQMRWLPVVTLFQVGVDMAVALGNLGYGHDYIARHYIPGWAAVLDPPGWDAADEARLIARLQELVPR